MARWITAITAASAPRNASARHTVRVLPPAPNMPRAIQNVSTPSTTVPSAISVAAGFTESVVHDGAGSPNAVN